MDNVIALLNEFFGRGYPMKNELVRTFLRNLQDALETGSDPAGAVATLDERVAVENRFAHPIYAPRETREFIQEAMNRLFGVYANSLQWQTTLDAMDAEPGDDLSDIGRPDDLRAALTTLLALLQQHEPELKMFEDRLVGSTTDIDTAVRLRDELIKQLRA